MKLVHRSSVRGIFCLVFAVLVAMGFQLHVAASASQVPVEQTVPDGTPKAGPPAVSTQEKPIPKPSDTILDTTVEIEIRSDLNELRRELLDYRMKGIDRWLEWMAIIVTLFAVVVPIVGFFGFKRFREIEIEARKGVENTKAATKEAKINVEKAKSLVSEIKSKHDEAVSHTEQIASMTVTKEPAKVSEAAVNNIRNSSASLIDQVIYKTLLLQREGKIEKAIRNWHTVAEIADGTDDELAAKAWFSIGYLHAKESRLQEAIDGYDAAVRLKPNYLEAFVNRGVAKSDLGQHDDAIADYDKAIELNPNDAEAFNNRGTAKICLGQNQWAIADYDKAICLKPDFAEAFNNRGIAKSGVGQNQGAIADYDKAIELNPDYANAFYNRGVAKNGLGRQDDATADYDKAIELDSRFKLAKLHRTMRVPT